jgi:hypothetical protein
VEVRSLTETRVVMRPRAGLEVISEGAPVSHRLRGCGANRRWLGSRASLSPSVASALRLHSRCGGRRFYAEQTHFWITQRLTEQAMVWRLR